jgi:hypothetical protein
VFAPKREIFMPNGSVLCKCGAPLDEKTGLREDQRVPCARCGSKSCVYADALTDEIAIFEGFRAKGVHAGMSRTKGWFIDSLSRWVPQRDRDNAIAHHERVLDRDGDRYTEKVTMRDSGEIIYSMNERLSEHQGHGSDKPKN